MSSLDATMQEIEDSLQELGGVNDEGSGAPSDLPAVEESEREELATPTEQEEDEDEESDSEDEGGKLKELVN